MILDKKLQLASNMSIGTAGRDFAGCKTAPLKISSSALRDFGRGETVYMCVTVKSDFTVADSYVSFSLCAEHAVDLVNITNAGSVLPDTGLLYHRLQPSLCGSGYIPGNFSSNTKNMVAGKKFIFPINAMPAKYAGYPEIIPTYGGVYDSNREVYFVFEEVSGLDLTAQNDITSGTIDVDIVNIAEVGAGPGFNDQVCYPTSIKVQ
jgi:hypothetical protein